MRKNELFLLAAILFVVFLAFSPGLKGEFLTWDDDVHLLNNLSLRGLDSEHLTEMFTAKVNKIYIPLTTLSFAIEYRFFGFNPFIYHLDNILLHLAVVGLVFIFARKLGLSLLAACGAALIFGLHPIHVESVVWVTERKDVLYALFYMLALLNYLKYLGSFKEEGKKGVKSKPAAGFLLLTFFLGILSMLAKPMALSLPFILVLLDWFKGKRPIRQAVITCLPLFLALGLLAWLSFFENQSHPLNIFQSFLIFDWSFVFYLRQFVFPLVVIPIHMLPYPIGLSNPEYILSLMITGLIIYSVFRFRHYRWYVFSVAFYVFSIFFLLRVEDIALTIGPSIVADRFMYLPCLGFCLFVGKALELKNTVKIKAVSAAVAAVALIFFVKTFVLAGVWSQSISLWQYQLKFSPNTPFALNNLAMTLTETEDFKKAKADYKHILELQARGLSVDPQRSRESSSRVGYLISLLEESIRIEPNFKEGIYNLGRLHKEVGLIHQASEYFAKAIEVDPKNKDAYFSLGELYRDSGNTKEAIIFFDKATAVDPKDEDAYIIVLNAYNKVIKDNPQYIKSYEETVDRYIQLINGKSARTSPWINLGILYAERGVFDRAVSAYQMALDINPDNSSALYNLGNAYKELGQFDDALANYQKAVEKDPGKSDAYVNMGIIYLKIQKPTQAEQFFHKAVEADKSNAKAYYNLGYVEESLDNDQAALTFYQKAVALDPANADGFYSLGNVFAKLKDNQKAMESYLKTVVVKPNHMDAWINLSLLSFQLEKFDDAVKYCDEAVLLGYEPPAQYAEALAPYRSKKQ